MKPRTPRLAALPNSGGGGAPVSSSTSTRKAPHMAETTTRRAGGGASHAAVSSAGRMSKVDVSAPFRGARRFAAAYAGCARAAQPTGGER